MKLNMKTLCSIGALLLCSESVLAAKITWNRYSGRDQVSVMIKGPICKNDQLKYDPFVVVRSVTFDSNNLEEFTPEIEDWLKKQTGLLSFSIQGNKFKEFPVKIFDWFPRLESVHFWGNPMKVDPVLLLSYGNLKCINGTCDAFSPDRANVNINRQRTIDRYKEKLLGVEDLLSKEKTELSDLQRQLESLNEQKLVLRKSKKSNRQKNFERKAINKSTKVLSQELAQKEGSLTNLLERKESFENVLNKLEKAQKKSLEILKREGY
ncbi:MAG: hypothetical protein J6P84_00680 [Alphaproteobacteria bacterium]|nr:hypothetical protein [Alphaproteobacteria bacterium]